jgi:drug/metabolite transporter (DMT)-like permease
MPAAETSTAQPFDRALIGIGLKLASVASLVASNGLVKLAPGVPVGEQFFFRSLAALLPIVAIMLLRGELPKGLATKRPFGHLWRGLLGGGYLVLMLVGLAHLPLPDVTTISYASPFFIAVFGTMLLGEKVGGMRWLAVVLGLVGVVIVMSPRLTLLTGQAGFGNEELLATVAAFGACMLGAGAMLTLRGLVRTERSSTIVFYFFTCSAVMGLASLPFGWESPSFAELAVILAAGLAAGCGQLLLTESYRYAELSTIAPFEYASILIAIAFGLVVFQDLPSMQMLAGGAVIMISGLLVVRHERRGLSRYRGGEALPSK